MFALPYRMLFAVATMDSISIHDTQQAGPIALLTKLHYDEFTDMTWLVGFILFYLILFVFGFFSFITLLYRIFRYSYKTLKLLLPPPSFPFFLVTGPQMVNV